MTNETNPYRLGRTIVPSAYRIFITPNLEDATFAGRVEIDVDITESTKEVKLNAIELELGAATLTADGTAHRSIDLRLDEQYEVATYSFDSALPAGPAGNALSKLYVATSYCSSRRRSIERCAVPSAVSVAAPSSSSMAFNFTSLVDSVMSTSISTRPAKVASSKFGVMKIR